MKNIAFFVHLLFLLNPVVSQNEDRKNANITAEVKLYKELLNEDTYVPAIRPVLDPSHAIKAQLHMEMLSLDGIDHGSQVLTAHIWLYEQWTDPLLTWNPDDYKGVKSLNIPIDKIWKPDITLWNNAMDRAETSYDYLAVVLHTGKVTYVPHLKASVLCRLNMKRFPYDTQNCGFKFGSWAYHSNKVNLTWATENDSGKMMGLSFYMEHQEWDVTAKPGQRNDYRHETHHYISLEFNIELKRKSTYYTNLFVTPAILLMFAIPSMFILPTESGEKVTLGVGILISQTMLIHMLNEFVPYAHSDVPVLGIYYIVSFVLVTLSLIISAMISRVWSQSDRQQKVPKCCRSIVLGVLGKLLCIGRDAYMPLEDQEPMGFRNLENKDTTDGQTFDSMERDDRAKMFKTYARMTSVAEWRQMAAVLDRFFLVLFTILVIVVTFMLSH